MNSTSSKALRKSRRILSILAGNIVQAAGNGLGCLLLWFSAAPGSAPVRTAAMIAGYLLIYFSSHSLTHYLVGRAAGIKFTHYSIGGTTHPATFPALIRPIFENMPFFAVHSDRESLHSAARSARALMFGSGIVGTALFSTLVSLYVFLVEVPGSTGLLIFNIIWQVSSLFAESGPRGDLGKAAQAIRK